MSSSQGRKRKASSSQSPLTAAIVNSNEEKMKINEEESTSSPKRANKREALASPLTGDTVNSDEEQTKINEEESTSSAKRANKREALASPLTGDTVNSDEEEMKINEEESTSSPKRANKREASSFSLTGDIVKSDDEEKKFKEKESSSSQLCSRKRKALSLTVDNANVGEVETNPKEELLSSSPKRASELEASSSSLQSLSKSSLTADAVNVEKEELMSSSDKTSSSSTLASQIEDTANVDEEETIQKEELMSSSDNTSSSSSALASAKEDNTKTEEPEMTPEQKEMLKLFNVVNRVEFGTCGDYNDIEKTILTVGCREIKVGNITGEDIAYLDKHLETAYYSKNNEKTTDLSVRNSKHTKAFNLNMNINNVVKYIRDEYIIKPYKLNLYQKGSFFKAHRDTHRPGLVGTLILILPTKYEGGELHFDNFNVEKHISENMDAEGKIRYVFFDNELEHEVSELVEGYRITLVYNVFDNFNKANIIESPRLEPGIPQEWVDKMVDYAKSFCKDKHNILMGDLKYRNDISMKVIEALKDFFKVIDVAVENNGLKPHEVQKAYIVTITHVNVSIDASPPDLHDIKAKSYDVEHHLFADNSEFVKSTLDYSYKTGFRGNSPYIFEKELEYFEAYLINPRK